MVVIHLAFNEYWASDGCYSQVGGSAGSERGIFRSEVSEDKTSWSWDFDDGTTSTAQHPVHQYKEAGEYIIVLTVQGPQGSARRVKVRQVVVR